MKYLRLLVFIPMVFWPLTLNAADTNTTVSSTVVTDKTPPTASAPSIVINNSDVCKSAYSAGVQSSIVGLSSGVTISDENCERIKLSRSLYGMGMKVAAISTLCQDARVFDAMWMAGTPCPYMGKIGDDAKTAWLEKMDEAPSGVKVFVGIKKKLKEQKIKEKKKKDWSKKQPTDNKINNPRGM